jgi:transglutaminase-like putative cysteine protease
LTGFYAGLERTSEAEKALAAGLVISPSDPLLLSARADALATLGRRADALAVYQKLLQLDPAHTGYRRSIAELYVALRDLPKAIRTLRAAREVRPQDGSLCATLADVLREAGQKQEAISLYRTAIALNPAHVALRDKLQVLSGEQPVLKLVPSTPLQPLLAGAAKAGDTAGASTVALLDEAVQVVYPDYATVTRFHQTVKILDAAAVQRYQSFPLAVPTATADATVETARLLKADGKTQNVAPGAFSESLTLPSLAVGDVIDVVYRVEDYQGGGLAKQFWSDWFFDYPGGPSRISRFVLVTPPDMAITTRAHGAVPEPTTHDVKGWRIREWKMENLPNTDDEVLGPARLDRTAWLDISTVSSWKDVVKWYQALSRPRCMPDAAVRAKAAELTKDATTEEAKLRAIVGYVSREIQYQTTPFRRSAYVPTEGKQVVRERYGDCKDKAALLTALLSTVGIKSEMVLLSGRSQGVTPYLPSPRFNHAIARVYTSKGPLWVDATADQMEFGGLPFEDQQVPALVINDETTDLVLSPALPVERNRLVDHHEGTLTADGKLTGRLQLEAGGDWGWMLRTAMRLVPEPKREQVLQAMSTQLVPNSRYERGTLQHLEEQDHPLGLDIHYVADSYSSRAGNFLLVRLPWGTSSGSGADTLLGKTARQSDAEVAQARGHYVSTVRLTLPAGYSPQELQPEVQGASPWGSYRLTYRMEGQTLHATREMKMTTLRVPTPDVAKYVEFLRAAEQETRKQLVLKKD